MLSAAEAAMERLAEDDAERAHIRARLYAPPAGVRGSARSTAAGRPQVGRMDRAGAEALMARLNAEDARMTR